MALRCSATNRAGEQCGRDSTPGATVCPSHGSRAPQVASRAAIRDAVSRWIPGQEVHNENDVLLRLMTVAYDRAEQHAAELNKILEEQGWHDAFVGDAYAVSENGKVHKVGEYARQLASWEQKERQIAADLAIKAVAANLAERNLKATERQVDLVFAAMRAALNEAGIGERANEVLGGVGRHLRVIAS